jgi:DNA-binding transcriptional LysR family regulator
VPVRWDDLRFVLALRSAGSLGGAARLLKCEQSTASRRIGALEADLGVQIVTRTPEGLVLNDAGLAVAELAETVDRGIEELMRRIGGEDARPEGVVKLATTDSTAAFLMSGLVPLRNEHPNIHVELLVANSAHDLLRREADLAVRMFRETSPSLLSRKIGDLGWSLYASAAFVARTHVAFGAAIDAAAIKGHPLIGFSGDVERSPGGRWVAAYARPEDIALRAGSVMAVINAVRNGLGLGVLPCFAVHGMSDVVRVTPAVLATTEAFLVIPPDRRRTARVRVVMDAVTALFERERDLLAGR